MLNLPPEKTALIKIHLFDSGVWLDLDRGVTTEGEVATKISSECDLTVDEVHRCFDTVRDSLVDFPESIALIREMKAAGVPLYALSNISEVNFLYLRERGYFDLFDGIVISAEEKLIKPDKRIFQVVLDRYGLDATKVVFVDDSLPNVQAAEAMEMRSVHFKRSRQCYEKVRECFPELSKG